MCVASCSRCVGVSLVPMAFVCMLANGLLLLPDLQARYLLDGHVTREARWGTGLWASGFLMCSNHLQPLQAPFLSSCNSMDLPPSCGQMLCQVGCSCVALAAAAFCCLVSATGLVQGPLCLHNSTHDPIYLFDRTLWPSACEEPRNVVQWNVVLFSVLMATSGLQAILCAAHAINAILGIIFGPRFCKNKEGPSE
uniref:Si:dkey-83h2.3 n=1 Tax=Hucho hucho TaxID=62062 RepID=A0A4W5QTA6_9TELE